MGLVKRTYVDGETVITADNLNDIQDEIIQNASDISTKGTYSKPTGGIPSTDMTTAVQTSLGKADSAYQKPSGGIPSTDLASAVQTSLGKADTALQSSDIDNTLTVSGKAADAKKTGDEISGVKNTLTDYAIDGTLPVEYDVEVGYVGGDGGNSSDGQNRYRRTTYIPLTEVSKITFTSYCQAAYYDSSKTFDSATGRITCSAGTILDDFDENHAYIRICADNLSMTTELFRSMFTIESVYNLLKQTAEKVEDLESYTGLVIGDKTTITDIDLTWTPGAYINAQGDPITNSSYSYSQKIPVQSGDILNGYMRFLTVFSDINTAYGPGFQTDISTYTVPEYIKYVQVTRSSAYVNEPLRLTHVTTASKADIAINGLKTTAAGIDSLTVSGVLNSSNSLSMTVYKIRKGLSISFYGKISTFDELSFGCGLSGFNTAHLVIDGTNVIYYGNDTVFGTTAHGLTFAEYIFVLINVDSKSGTPTIVINTKTGSYTHTYDGYNWLGCNGTVNAEVSDTTSLTDCVLSYFSKDTEKPIWYFGDSYMSPRDPARLPSHLIYAKAFENICSIGFAGASANTVSSDINRLFNSNKYPQYIVWGIGMNDADTNGAINQSWKNITDNLKALCDSCGVKLILCTIPNTPTVDNQYKNAYVRESGLRYVDYASAVNTSLSGGTWIDGALSSDNVHPTEIGARILASKLMTDFPEMLGI